MEERLYTRLEQLERHAERMSAVISEHARRLDGLEEMRDDIKEISRSLARLESRMESNGKINSILQALIWLILGGIVAAGFELMKR